MLITSTIIWILLSIARFLIMHQTITKIIYCGIGALIIIANYYYYGYAEEKLARKFYPELYSQYKSKYDKYSTKPMFVTNVLLLSGKRKEYPELMKTGNKIICFDLLSIFIMFCIFVNIAI